MKCPLCNNPMISYGNPLVEAMRCLNHSYIVSYDEIQNKFSFYYRYDNLIVTVSISDVIKIRTLDNACTVTFSRPNKISSEILNQYLKRIYKMKAFL